MGTHERTLRLHAEGREVPYHRRRAQVAAQMVGFVIVLAVFLAAAVLL